MIVLISIINACEKVLHFAKFGLGAWFDTEVKKGLNDASYRFYQLGNFIWLTIRSSAEI